MGNGAALCVSARAHPRLYHRPGRSRATPGSGLSTFCVRRCRWRAGIIPRGALAIISANLRTWPSWRTHSCVPRHSWRRHASLFARRAHQFLYAHIQAVASLLSSRSLVVHHMALVWQPARIPVPPCATTPRLGQALVRAIAQLVRDSIERGVRPNGVEPD